MGDALSGIALAAIALAATTVGGLIYVIKWVTKELSADLRAHTKAATQLTEASKEQRQASGEVLKFMKNLNGKLEGAFIDKVGERSNRTRIKGN